MREGLATSPVNIDVSGEIFKVNPSTIMQYPDTTLGSMLSERWNMMVTTYYKSTNFAEVEYCSLPLEKDDIHFDIQSIAEIRQGLEVFDSMFAANLKKTTHETAMVICANELTGLFIEKIRESRGKTEIRVHEFDIPANSFSGVMFRKVGFDSHIFKRCIEDIVQ